MRPPALQAFNPGYKSNKRIADLKIIIPEKKIGLDLHAIVSPKYKKSITVDETIVVKGEHSMELKINTKFFGGPQQ